MWAVRKFINRREGVEWYGKKNMPYRDYRIVSQGISKDNRSKKNVLINIPSIFSVIAKS